MLGKDSTERRTPAPASIVNKRRRISLGGIVLPHWKAFSLGMLAVVGEALTDLAQPWPLKIIVDLVGALPQESERKGRRYEGMCW